VDVGANGLAGDTLGSLDLIGGSVSLAGAVRLPGNTSAAYVITGANQVPYNTLAPTTQARTDAVPAQALQITSAGGLYANQIYLLATEQGVGVNHAGSLQARAGGLTLDAAGRLTLAGTLQSSGGAVVVAAPEISASQLTLNATGLGLLQSAGPMSLSNSTLAGADLMLVAGGLLSAQGTGLRASGDARLSAGGELVMTGGRIDAGGNVALSATGDLSLLPDVSTASANINGTQRTTTRYSRVEVKAGGSVSAQSTAGMVTLDGTQMASSGAIALLGQGMALLARKDVTAEISGAGNTTTKPTTETLVGVRLQADGDIAILASGTGTDQGNLLANGAQIESNSGHVSLLAAKNVEFSHDTTTDLFYQRFYEVRRRWFSKRVTETIKSSIDETVQAGLLSGRSVSIGAGGQLSLVGSAVFADGAVGLHADGDLNLLSAAEHDQVYQLHAVKKSGIFGNGGLSITIGSKSTTTITSSDTRLQHGSSVASLAGDISATAGGQYLQMSSDLTAPQGDISIAAAGVALSSSPNTTSVLNLIRQRQSGLTLSASHPLIEAVQSVDQMAKLASRTTNGRYQALGLLTSGLTIYNNFRALDKPEMDLASPINGGGIGGWTISATLGSSNYSFDSLTKSSTPVGSSIDAGRHLTITSTGSGADSGDITLVAAKLSAGADLRLSAARDLTLSAAIGSNSEDTKTRSSSGAVGLSYSGSGLAVTAAASRSNGYSNGWGTTYWQSQAAAVGTLTLSSGRNTALNGAKASGNQVVGRVGNSGAGDLAITSPQDEDHYIAREQSYGFNISVPVPGYSTGNVSIGLSRSQLSLLADYQAVREQSAINAGLGGFDITVNGHTHLRGGAITTEGASAASRLVTQSLTHESVANKDVTQGGSWSVSLAIANRDKNANGQELGALAGSSAGYARIQTDVRSSTDSSVGGMLTLSRPDLQAGRVGAMAAAERAPLEAKRADAQQRLNALYDSEPLTSGPLTSGPTGLQDGMQASVQAGVQVGVQVGVPARPRGLLGVDSLVVTAPAADTGTGSADLAAGTNPGWINWAAKVRAVQAEIAKLDGRITAINNKTYLDASTLSGNPSSLHQPLLHTFDRARATQELKDGVAVTAAFGKAAFRTAGDVAKTEYDKAVAACGGNATNCPEADKWKEGGLYKSALHGVVGALSFGQAGGLAALTAEAASPKLREAILAAGIPDGSIVFNALMLGAKAMVGAGVGAAAGGASAFNADANNRQLHSNEKARIQQLANGDGAKEQRLSAAACYLVHCSGEFPIGTEAWDALTRLERIGSTMTAELAQLRQQTDAGGALFSYTYLNGVNDDWKRINNKYSLLTKLGGGLQIVGGSASTVAGGTIVAAGGATCAPSAGVGCVVAVGGALLTLWGEDQILAGTRAITSGVPQYTLGARLISEVTGISLGSAELWYALPGVVTGGNAALTATAQTKQLAWDWRFAGATHVDFKGAPQGIEASAAIMSTPQAQSLIREIQASRAGMPYNEAYNYAEQAVQSGTALPAIRSVLSGETLYKVVPRGAAPSDVTAYWMSAPQAVAISKMSIEDAARVLGLPVEQLQLARSSGGFDYFSMTLKPGQGATVFESTVASTQQRMFEQGGGAKQTIVPNRTNWDAPVKINVQPGRPIVSPKSGG